MHISKQNNLESLRKKIKPILGQSCWQARLGYGDELCLEIGKKIKYDSPLLQEEFKGEWQFGTRGTDWQLNYNNVMIANSESEYEKIIALLKAIEQTKIRRFEVNPSNLILTINFDNGYQLQVIPDLTDIEYQDIACWELFTPNHRVLEVYPNFTWYDSPSDIPMNETLTIK